MHDWELSKEHGAAWKDKHLTSFMPKVQHSNDKILLINETILFISF